MIGSRIIDPPLTSHFQRILQHALYHPGLLGALETGSEESFMKEGFIKLD